jgi:hypothetical protein
MTKGQARALLIAAVVGVVLLLAGFGVYVWRTGTDMIDALPNPVGPDAVTSAFLAAYEHGDTPTMCALSTGDALTRLQDPGWCTTKPGWSTTATAAQQCTIPDGRQVHAYTLNPLVLGQRGMEFAVTDTGDGVWRVTTWGHTADRTLCDIYR